MEDTLRGVLMESKEDNVLHVLILVLMKDTLGDAYSVEFIRF